MTRTDDRVVIRQLPYLMRKGGRFTAVSSFARSLAIHVEQGQKDLKALLASRYLSSVGDLGDANKLGQWFDQQAWPEENLAAFQQRVRTVAQIILQGATNAERMAALARVACAADWVPEPETEQNILGPRESVTEPGWWPLRPSDPISNDRFTTRAVFRRPSGSSDGGPNPSIPCSVEDMPWQRMQQDIPSPVDGDWRFAIDNPLIGTPPDPHPNNSIAAEPMAPAFVIRAGPDGFALPVIVQRQLRRAVLVNVRIPPHGAIAVDLLRQEVVPLENTIIERGILQQDGELVADLLFSAPILTDSSRWEPGSDPGHFTQWVEDIDLAADGHAPTSQPIQLPLLWPELLPTGHSRWTILRGEWKPGQANELSHIRVRRCDKDHTPFAIRVVWDGRERATFTVRVPEVELSPDGAAMRPASQRMVMVAYFTFKIGGH